MSQAATNNVPKIELCQALHAFHAQIEHEPGLGFNIPQVMTSWARALELCGFDVSLGECVLNVGTPSDFRLFALVAADQRFGRQGQIGWDQIIRSHGMMPMQPDKFYWHATDPEPVVQSPDTWNKIVQQDRRDDYDRLIALQAAFVQQWVLDHDTAPSKGIRRSRHTL
jgi:hypothetical protein